MALEVPLVPINSNAKVFEAQNVLQEAINNLRFAQQKPAQPQQAKADQAEDEKAKQSVLQQLARERLFQQQQNSSINTAASAAIPSSPMGDINIAPDVRALS